MNLAEPDIIARQDPEATLQKALAKEIDNTLSNANVNFKILEGFGLDIAVFIQKNGRSYMRFIEVKAFVGSRGGGVGFGSGSGQGSQVDLLLPPESELSITEPYISWVLGHGKLPKGSSRYTIFTNTQTKDAAMGGVARGKQNNLRVSEFLQKLISWEELLLKIR